jgi:hypothetical protein
VLPATPCDGVGVVETMRWAETVATLTVPAAAIAMPAATTLDMLRRVRCARSVLLSNHLATLMPPYPAGAPAVLYGRVPTRLEEIDATIGSFLPNAAISLIQPNKPVTAKQVMRLTFATTTTSQPWGVTEAGD